MLLQNFSTKVLHILLFVQQNQISEPQCLWWNTIFVFHTDLPVTYKCWQHEATVVTQLVRKINLGLGLSPLWAPGDRCPSGCCLTGLLVSIKPHTTNSQQRGSTPSEYPNRTITEWRLFRYDQMLLHLFLFFSAVPVSRALFWTMPMVCCCHSCLCYCEQQESALSQFFQWAVWGWEFPFKCPLMQLHSPVYL